MAKNNAGFSSIDITGNIATDGTIDGTIAATSTLADGVVATTQTASDNSTKVATTAYVDAQVTAEDLDIAGDSGTGSVDLDSQSLTIAGTTDEIETSASSQTLTIGLPATVKTGLIVSPTEELTATGTVTATTKVLELNHISVVIAATLAASAEGLFMVRNTSASGTVAHTLTLTAGTFDGTNNVATLDAPGEALMVYFDADGDGMILANRGSVALS